MDKEKEIEKMAKELHCATSESFISCRKIARILVERCGYGNVKQAVKEFAEKFKEYASTRYYGQTRFKMLRAIDNLITELYGADDKE